MPDPTIRTPDERLRVFVSSTLEELAEERAAVRRAVERLRLTPVLFELGARAHPPQDVYQAYLDRSDVFVGIYGERYGWIGPGMEISGLEDEYLRSAGKPRLLYVKTPAPAREARLLALIERLMLDATVSFKTFRDQDELEELVANDLALLLTERFVSDAPRTTRTPHSALPSDVDEFVGREAELAALHELLERGSRLLTVTGPGGVGKTRLAIEAARRSHALFPDGVHFVGLSSVREAELVVSSILTTLELEAGPATPGGDALVDHLRGSRLLLLLDNFEQVLDAATEIGRLLAACPDLRVLVTSRSVLKLRGEHEFAVAPLPIPEAVRLFARRAGAVTQAFELTDENAEPVEEICRRLEGLPLAIELAAARVRTLPAESLLPLLERRLEFLTGGGRDSPERHRTLQATIDWSFNLLEPSEQDLLGRASVFRGGWDLSAATAVCGETVDVLSGIESLLEKSLVRHEPVGGAPRFTMLETIREYAAGKLEASGHAEDARHRHAVFFIELALAAGDELRGGAQAVLLDRLEFESDNVRAALRFALDEGHPERVAAAGWALMPFWWLRGLFDEGARWMTEAIDSGRLSEEGRAQALLALGFMAFFRGDYGTALPALTEALGVFSGVGDRHRSALARIPLAVVQASRGDETAIDPLEESRAVLAEAGDEWGLMVALNALCWALNALEADAPPELYEDARRKAEAVGTKAELATALGNLSRRRMLRGEPGEAKLLLADALEIVRDLRSPTGIAYYTEMTADVASGEGDHATSVRFFAAATAIRAASEAETPLHALALHERALAAARSALGDEAVEAARASGADLGAYEAAAEAIAWSNGSG